MCSTMPKPRLIVAQDQEQVDKILSIARPAAAAPAHSLRRGARPCATIDDAAPAFARRGHRGGRAALADPAVARRLDRRIDAGRGADPSVILYTSGTTGRSKGVVLTGERCIAAARDTVAFDKLTDRDEVLAYLPLAWVGDHYLNYAQGFVAGFCMACPESADTAPSDLREIGPTFHFAPPRVFEALLTRVHDPHGGRRRDQALAVPALSWRRQALGRKDRQRRAGSVARAAALCARRIARSTARSRTCSASPASASPTPRAKRSAPTSSPSIARSASTSSSSTARPRRFSIVTAQADGAVRSDAVGPPAPHVDLRIAGDGEVQFKSPGMFVGYYREPDKTREALTADGFVKTGDAGFFEPDGQLKIVDRAKDVGRLANGQLFAPKYIENKLKFFPNISEAVAIGEGRDFVAAMLNIELASVGNWAERNNVSYASYQELAGQSARLRDDRRPCRRGQPGAGERAGDGGRADQALPHPAEGARRRRRRTDPHAEGAARLHRRALRPAGRRPLQRRGRGFDLGRDHLRGRPQGHARRHARASSTLPHLPDGRAEARAA